VLRVIVVMITKFSDVGYRLPIEFYKQCNGRQTISTGDKEALSSLIAAYSFTSNVGDLMRFVSAFASTLQSYLVKEGRALEYYGIFHDISVEIANARILLDSPRGSGQAAVILYSVETALKIIAEREGLTMTSISMYEGKMPFTPADYDYSDKDDAYTL